MFHILLISNGDGGGVTVVKAAEPVTTVQG